MKPAPHIYGGHCNTGEFIMKISIDILLEIVKRRYQDENPRPVLHVHRSNTAIMVEFSSHYKLYLCDQDMDHQTWIATYGEQVHGRDISC